MPVQGVGETASHLLAESGLRITDSAQLAVNLKSNKPNTDNLVEISYQGQEIRFGADKMPLLGGYPNSYDQAPDEYARVLGDYPRADSPSRVEANQTGAQMNIGAARHLSVHYAAAMSILSGLATAERGEAAVPDDDQLTLDQARDVLQGAIWMWSYVSYRKQGRTPKDKLPPEIALLHRAMSGVRMSLLRLYINDGTHGHSVLPGAEGRTFSAESWAGEVETNRLLISPEKLVEEEWLTSPEIEAYTSHEPELCPASSRMIRHVLGTIVNYSPEPSAVDIEDAYGVKPEVLLAYGDALDRLELARLMRNRATSYFGHEIMTRLRDRAITPDLIQLLKGKYADEMSEIARATKKQRDEAFAEAIDLLGYDVRKFKVAKSAI